MVTYWSSILSCVLYSHSNLVIYTSICNDNTLWILTRNCKHITQKHKEKAFAEATLQRELKKIKFLAALSRILHPIKNVQKLSFARFAKARARGFVTRKTNEMQSVSLLCARANDEIKFTTMPRKCCHWNI